MDNYYNECIDNKNIKGQLWWFLFLWFFCVHIILHAYAHGLWIYICMYVCVCNCSRHMVWHRAGLDISLFMGQKSSKHGSTWVICRLASFIYRVSSSWWLKPSIDPCFVGKNPTSYQWEFQEPKFRGTYHI